MATIEKYETKSGAMLYRVRFRTPDKRSTQKRGFKRKADAELFAATVEVNKSRGEYVAPAVGRVTVGELGPAWLDRQRAHMKPSSFPALRECLAGSRVASMGHQAHRRHSVYGYTGMDCRVVGEAKRLDDHHGVLGAGAHPR
jgi:hypothetical protein